MRDVIVVGAGILGAMIAYRLSQSGTRVTVLEAERPAAAASRRSFAWYNAHHKLPRAYHDLNAAGVAAYPALAEALGGHGEYVTRPADFRPALERAYDIAARERKPVVINCQGKKEFWDRTAYPPGMIGKVEPGVMSYYH